MDTNSLQDTLDALLAPGTDSNPALNALLSDYAEYHLVLVPFGGLFLLAFAMLAIFSWRRLRRTPRSEHRRWTFERVTYCCFGASSLFVALLIGLVTAANLGNALDGRQGFSGVVATVGTPGTGTRVAEVHQAFTTWLQSGNTAMPRLIASSIDERLAWQRPKAIICAVLLLAAVLLSARVWRAIIRRSRSRQEGWTRRDVGLLFAGLAAGPLCVLLMAMVIGNTQASFAPLSLTLVYG